MPEPALPPSWDGSVVLDIGGEIGALVLRTPADLSGTEIDLRPDDAAEPHTHSAVRERRLPAGSFYAAVYPSLRAGGYTIVGSTQRIAIDGGHVTDVDLASDALDHAGHVHDDLRSALGHTHDHVHAGGD